MRAPGAASCQDRVADRPLLGNSTPRRRRLLQPSLLLFQRPVLATLLHQLLGTQLLAPPWPKLAPEAVAAFLAACQMAPEAVATAVAVIAEPLASVRQG